MWYSIDNNGFKWNEILDLYRIVEQREQAFREQLFRFTNFYAAVCYAILGVTLSGFFSLYSHGAIVLCLLFGPLLTLCMCFLGLRVTSRIYHRIVEEISVKAKIENALGLDRPIPITQFMGKDPVWPQDESLLPPRHTQRRFQNTNSASFIESSAHKGFYRDNRLYFWLIGAFSILMGLAILLNGILAKN